MREADQGRDNIRRVLRLLAVTTLVVIPGLCAAQDGDVALPSDDQIREFQRKAAEAIAKVPPSPAMRAAPAVALPTVGAIPKPIDSTFDLADVAEKHTLLTKPLIPSASRGDLAVFVSLSMPRGALDRIIDQAERSGATLVFRGLKGNSMKEMSGVIGDLLGRRKVSAVIHPPAFQQFTVTQVPAVVLAKAEAGDVLDNGCAQADTFVKVTGDVTIDYALEYIERHSPAWAAMAQSYRRKIIQPVSGQ